MSLPTRQRHEDSSATKIPGPEHSTPDIPATVRAEVEIAP
jgi:hypothetical protein